MSKIEKNKKYPKIHQNDPKMFKKTHKMEILKKFKSS